MSDDEQLEYVVEDIVAWRYNLRRVTKEYNVKWANYPEEENTWEPEENLNCPHILSNFINKLKPKDLGYYNSTTPHKLSGFQRHANFLRCVGSDGPHDSDDESSDKPDKQKFYCLIQFEDSDYIEEISIGEFFENEPRAALEFFEARIRLKN